MKKIIAIFLSAILGIVCTACSTKTLAEKEADAYSAILGMEHFAQSLNMAGTLKDAAYVSILKIGDTATTGLDDFRHAAKALGTLNPTTAAPWDKKMKAIVDSIDGIDFSKYGITDAATLTKLNNFKGIAKVGIQALETFLAGIKGTITVTPQVIAEFDRYYDQRIMRDMEVGYGY